MTVPSDTELYHAVKVRDPGGNVGYRVYLGSLYVGANSAALAAISFFKERARIEAEERPLKICLISFEPPHDIAWGLGSPQRIVRMTADEQEEFWVSFAEATNSL